MIDILKSVAGEAGVTLLKYYRKNLTLNYKTSHKDFYTIADIESQKLIKKNLTAALVKKGVKESDIGFIGEENLFEGTNKKHLFVVDPLDGTSNFASGFDFFSVSIGYFLDGQLTAGVVYRPTSRDFYYAQKGQGAYKNGQRLKVLYKPLKQCLLDGTISSRPHRYLLLFKIYQRIFPYVSGFRSLASITVAAALLTENVLNVLANGHIFIWDLAAVKLIIEEAGGAMFDFKGQPISLDFNDPKKPYEEIIICHPKLKDEILKFFEN